MNKLIIVGNGFDLAHGLKTRYSDFLVWYLGDVTKKNLSEHGYEDELIMFDSAPVKYNYTPFGSIGDYLAFNERFLIKPRYKDDFFHKLIINSHDYKWVDIESEYYRRIIKFYKDAEINDFKYWDTECKSILSFHINFNFIKSKLLEYIQSLSIDEQTFSHPIATTLEQIVFEPDWELTENNKDDSVLILNFNYTPTLKLYHRELNFPLTLEIINIHGSINSGMGSIIFGYGDEMDPYYQKIENLNSNELLKNIKSFSYLKNNNYQNFRLFADSDKFNVYILGHSCGLSDRILLNSIFEHKNCESIKIYYHKRTDTDNDYTEKTMEISRHFGPQNKDLMRRRIVPFDKCSPLT
jgi:hypothetical protein